MPQGGHLFHSNWGADGGGESTRPGHGAAFKDISPVRPHLLTFPAQSKRVPLVRNQNFNTRAFGGLLLFKSQEYDVL